jgi:glycosyltransferase involved in cell wall biosynthesis
MKNLCYALELLKYTSGEVMFDIYGPKEDKSYWRECEHIVASLGQDVNVRYMGEIQHDQALDVLGEYDLFLLPTLGENYGHVVSEALSAGCPVLISDRTPWRGLEKEGVGWDIPLENKQRFVSVLQYCIDADDDTLYRMHIAARQYALRKSQDSEVLDANRRLFQYASSRRATSSSLSPA